MSSVRFIVLAVLFVGCVQINANEETTSSPRRPLQTVVKTDIKGRLLTPEEGCGYSKVSNTRIVGGAPAKIGAWPWIALLGYRIGWATVFKAGGTLITTRHVLTAAHCALASLSIVRLGEHDRTTTDDGQHQDIKVLDAEKHDFFNSRIMINDIAMVYLERDVEFTDRISPICLPLGIDMRHVNHVGANPFIAGWGLQEENSTLSDVLQQVQVPVITNAECKMRYRKIGNYLGSEQFSERHVLCAGYTEGGKDSCQGDSGGPLMMPIYQNGRFPFYQIGIISYGVGCAREKVPGVYVNVAKYAHWIKVKLHVKKEKKVDGDDFDF